MFELIAFLIIIIMILFLFAPAICECVKMTINFWKALIKERKIKGIDEL